MENKKAFSNQEIDNEVLSAIAEEEFLTLHLPDPVEDPYLLLLGGFQGSGKTTTINNLTKELDICVISHDRLRHRLLNKIGFIPESNSVNMLKLKLLDRVLPIHVPITVDANTTPKGVNALKQFLLDSHNPHRVFSVFLDADKEELIKRVKTRGTNQNLGMHLGTLHELEKTLKDLGEIDISLYDLILNTHTLSQEEILFAIKNLLN